MFAGDLYYFMLLFFGVGIIATFFTSDNAKYTNYMAHSMAFMGCTLAVLCAFFVFSEGEFTISLSTSLPFGPIRANLDYLAAYFLLITGVVGAATSIYAYGYSKEYYHCRLPLMAGLYNAFLLSMVLVFTVSHVVGFIIAWEVMSLVSFFLVNHEYEHKINNRSAYIYIVMTHIGTAFIITAFLLLAVEAHSMDFSQLHQLPLSETVRNIIFICVIIGFGTKAGMIPVHIWLPRAHPAAPSHISALMSGIMLKTAIYGMCRFFLEFLGAGPVWWGVLVLVLAIITAVIGVLFAFIEHDLKRLLAYSSIENMGIILLGIGAGMVFMSSQQPALAGVAFCAALYHVFNHAVFKALAFMSAGAVLQAAHTKNMEQLGGLIKKMPYTAVFCLVSSVAIAALPPLNGFVSEWLIFQALLFLPHALAGIAGKVLSAILIALLGLTGALAAACFVEVFGITFLAKPRSKQAKEAVEAGPCILAAMAMLAGGCILLGIWPQGLLMLLNSALMNVPGLDSTALLSHDWYRLSFATGPSSGGISTVVMLLLLFGGIVVVTLVQRIFGTKKTVIAETWTCGIVPNAHMEYTATGFSKSIRMVFKSIVHDHYETLINANENKYHGQKLSYHVRIQYLFVSAVYRPINAAIIRLAHFMKSVQAGSVQLYVGYIMTITVLILIWSTRW